MTSKLKIYCASRLRHAPKWRELETLWTEFEFTGRWYHEPHIGTGTNVDPENACTPEAFRIHWINDEIDVRRADVVMVYAGENVCAPQPNGDILRSALVEAGMGIAFDKGVLLVGDSPSFGTWKHHPNCHSVPDLVSARLALQAQAKV